MEGGKNHGSFLEFLLFKDSDYITEQQLEVLRVLRKIGYSGYVHLRLMPDVSQHCLREAVELSDRVGVNLEAPNKEVFSELCPDKGNFKEAILKRLGWVVDEVQRAKPEASESKFGFAKADVDTQMIVGAVDDNDWQYLEITEWLYKRHGLRRVYYSGFEPIPQTPLQTGLHVRHLESIDCTSPPSS